MKKLIEIKNPIYKAPFMVMLTRHKAEPILYDCVDKNDAENLVEFLELTRQFKSEKFTILEVDFSNKNYAFAH